MERLTPGTPAPQFTLPTTGGGTVSLADYAGQKVIVYFYPKASTPGCTTQACDFRDNLASLTSHGYAVLGISPDSVKALDTFTENQELTFPLLSDEDHAVAEAYGAWDEKKNYGKTYVGLIRSTLVIDEKGMIEVAQYNVRAKGHVAKLRRDLGIDS
ncbi:thioredoxin-dependent thiol peroxidase [Rothia nasimurium]|uniref:thioredoxin-dependent peroxiredoxin n=1 Tax=Rothia nasimurium TaxID=85336 RepID=A0A4Y9F218_9MICC|nr:thioredoxin-dependent thiol peroxidase [Rothia nasimurium]MBF0808749.1 thioredoxin-dependent thiol peroxidase [Rothia nasimurium]TFU21379.1 thioredoxin-dependent thiol peroxidase [Rothia nasimurium]